MRPALIIVLALTCGCVRAPAQPLVNRLATCAGSPQELVFIDASTGEVVTHALVPGHVHGNSIAMDRYGGVWLTDAITYALYRYDPSGQLTAFVPQQYRAGGMTTTPQGTLLVVSTGVSGISPVSNRAILQEFATDGTLLRSLDIVGLYPPGVLYPQFSDYARGLVSLTSSGHLWVGLAQAGYRGLFRLDPQWNLLADFALDVHSIRPDVGGGIWASARQIPGQPAPAGLPVFSGVAQGLVQLDANGVVTQSFGLFQCGYGGGTFMRTLPDGTLLGMHSGGGFPAPHPHVIGVRNSSQVGAPAFLSANDIVWPIQPQPYPAFMPTHLRGFALDGWNRIWAWSQVVPNGSPTWELSFFDSAPVPSPVGRVPLGVASNAVPVFGEPTLHTYALHTDPQGDLDGDGQTNRGELLAGSNPFVAQGPAISLSIVYPPVPPLGGWIRMNYLLSGEAGMAYFAPITLSAQRTSVAGRYLPFSLSDPLIPFSVAPNVPWLSGSIGVVDSSGQVQVSLFLPPGIPSGSLAHNALLTFDPVSLGLRMVTPAYDIFVQ